MTDETLKIILVDDEYLVRDLLKKCVNWADLGMVIAGEASNAHEAMSLVEQTRPDIIFTDICMSSVNGIELSEMVLEKYPSIKIVIITGYEDFDYVKRSLKAGVADYLLKPINNDEIMKVALNIKAKVIDERKHWEEYFRLKKQLTEALPYLKGIQAIHFHDTNLSISKGWNISNEQVDLFIFYLKAGLKEQFLKTLETFFKEISVTQKVTIDFLRINASNIVTLIFNVITESGINITEIFADTSEPYAQIFRIETLPEIREYLKKTSLIALDAINNLRRKKVNKVVKEIQDYLITNYHNSELSLSSVAKHFFLNPSYLSRIFKQETNRSFIEYLTGIRMEKAISLFKDTDLKVYQIAEMVGITDPHYFSICFKKYTGKSVNDYKKVQP